MLGHGAASAAARRRRRIWPLYIRDTKIFPRSIGGKLGEFRLGDGD